MPLKIHFHIQKGCDFHQGVSAFVEKRRPARTLAAQRRSSTT
jgi:hypothetical protein